MTFFAGAEDDVLPLDVDVTACSVPSLPADTPVPQERLREERDILRPTKYLQELDRIRQRGPASIRAADRRGTPRV